MAVQLNIRLEPEQRDKLTKLAKKAGMTLKNETLRLETESSKKSWWKFW